MTRKQQTASAKGTRHSHPSSTDDTIAELERVPRNILAAQWRTLYRSEPPKGVGQRFLIGAIAHALQLRQAGRKQSSVQRRLERHTKSRSPSHAPKTATPQKLQPGARLIRDWNGSTHTVDVTEDGFVWNDERYRSLSAIARAITGARWSGPRFFGLTYGDRT